MSLHHNDTGWNALHNAHSREIRKLRDAIDLARKKGYPLYDAGLAQMHEDQIQELKAELARYESLTQSPSAVASAEDIKTGLKPIVGIGIEEGLVIDVSSNVQIDHFVVDYDVFDDCAGGLEGECDSEEPKEQREEHAAMRAGHARLNELQEGGNLKLDELLKRVLAHQSN